MRSILLQYKQYKIGKVCQDIMNRNSNAFHSQEHYKLPDINRLAMLSILQDHLYLPSIIKQSFRRKTFQKIFGKLVLIKIWQSLSKSIFSQEENWKFTPLTFSCEHLNGFYLQRSLRWFTLLFTSRLRWLKTAISREIYQLSTTRPETTLNLFHKEEMGVIALSHHSFPSVTTWNNRDCVVQY